MSQWIPFDSTNWALRLLLAQGVIILLALLTVVSFSVPYAGDFKPFFLLMAVYYWAIYRPTVMPVAYTFVLGLILDLIAELPVGMTALLLVAVQTLVQKSRVFLMGQPYIMVWLAFGLVCLAYAVALWFFMSLAAWNFHTLHALVYTLIAAGFSVMLFPAVSFVLQAVHRLLPVTSGPLHTVR